MSCLEISNVTISDTAETWGSIDHDSLQGFSPSSYLRPDAGGALLPWVYTIIIIVIHVPVVIIRVVRWEIVQTWCIVATLFTVILYTQAYISTGFAADKILVWTPIILVIDAGSMLQIFFLVLEAKPVMIEGRIFLFDPKKGEASERWSLLGRLRRWCRREPKSEKQQIHLLAAVTQSGNTSDSEKQQNYLLETVIPSGSMSVHSDSVQNTPSGSETGNDPASASNTANDDVHSMVRTESNVPKRVQIWRDPAVYAAISSALLFIVVTILQILGLHAAIVRYDSKKSPQVSWCATIFQPFGIAMADGNCNVYNVVHKSDIHGIGCIKIPGVWQRQWLRGTIILTSLGLGFQVVDLLILSLVHNSCKWRGVKMRRPWTTMISGLVVLCITLFYGLQYASMLPPGITERVTIAVELKGMKAFDATLTTAGLRGAIIGWNDGLFESWGGSYFGSHTH